jgi:DNA gyrase subunit A
MTRRTRNSELASPPPEQFEEKIVDIDVAEEMQGSFLEYAYSVIYSRALPDARDGLKPVHRRILYQMGAMGLRPDRGHVKSARVVGEVMGRLHPHGDGAIYDALVRMAQPFSMRLPLVDGHGNFGSLGNDDPPAAMRYTECRLTPAAMLMTASLDEDVVDFRPNYDDREQEPAVLPAAAPNLLVNGASGIAVGMATNMPPHNLGEVIAAARHLLEHPDAGLDDIMRFVPGPDFPTGGKILGLAGIRDSYATGRGSFRTRATTTIAEVRGRRRGIVVTELPYLVGPEKVIGKVKELVQAKKLLGISDIRDLTDRASGLRLVIEVKNGFNPDAVLAELYRLTPMEEGFGINNVALVEGQPQTLGLVELLRVYVKHRLTVVRRRTEHRHRTAAARLHLVAGLMVAILNIDEVIQVIRSSEDSGEARQRLQDVFELSEEQATYILDMPLRRLTQFNVLELEQENGQLGATIAELTAILASDSRLRALVSDELAEVARAFGTPRRTVLLESVGPQLVAASLEISDDPCRVFLSSTGRLARASGLSATSDGQSQRAAHDVITSTVQTTARGTVAAVTDRGRMVAVDVVDLPALPPTVTDPSLAGGVPVAECVNLAAGERVLCLASMSQESPGIALGTASGVVKRVNPEYPGHRSEWELIALKDHDRIIGAVELSTGEEDLVFISSDAQLLRFPAAAVRPQGRAAAGMAGIRLTDAATVVFFGATSGAASAVLTVASSSAALPGTGAGSAKVTPFKEYPVKGRGTGGVRCHRFLRGEDTITLAWVGVGPPRAANRVGDAIELPEIDGRRDGSGSPLTHIIGAVSGPTPAGTE